MLQRPALGVYHHIGAVGLEQLRGEPEARFARARRADHAAIQVPGVGGNGRPGVGGEKLRCGQNDVVFKLGVGERLACLLSELPQSEIEKFEAALHIGTHTSSVADIINLAQNLDSFEFYPDIENEDDLGRYYTEDLAIPAELKDYFDYEAYGRDVSINEGGHFAPGGYIVQTGDVKEYYHGIQDIPKEHKVFSMPQLSIREQMAAYKEVIDRSSLEAERKHPEMGRGDR